MMGSGFVFTLDTAIMSTVPDYFGRLYEIDKTAPIRSEILIKIKDIIEILNRGIVVKFNDDYLQPVYDLVVSFNQYVDSLLESGGVDEEDLGLKKALVAESYLSKQLGIVTKNSKIKRNIFARAEEENRKTQMARVNSSTPLPSNKIRLTPEEKLEEVIISNGSKKVKRGDGKPELTEAERRRNDELELQYSILRQQQAEPIRGHFEMGVSPTIDIPFDFEETLE